MYSWRWFTSPPSLAKKYHSRNAIFRPHCLPTSRLSISSDPNVLWWWWWRLSKMHIINEWWSRLVANDFGCAVMEIDFSLFPVFPSRKMRKNGKSSLSCPHHVHPPPPSTISNSFSHEKWHTNVEEEEEENFFLFVQRDMRRFSGSRREEKENYFHVVFFSRSTELGKRNPLDLVTSRATWKSLLVRVLLYFCLIIVRFAESLGVRCHGGARKRFAWIFLGHIRNFHRQSPRKKKECWRKKNEKRRKGKSKVLFRFSFTFLRELRRKEGKILMI